MFGTSFWLGSLVVLAWAAQNFFEPYSANEVRYSTNGFRFWFGRLFYIGTALYAYIVCVLIVIVITRVTSPSLIRIDFADGGRTVNGWIAPISSLAILWTSLYVPACARVIEFVRLTAQNVSLFPYELRALITAMSRSAFKLSEGADKGVVKEICRYGAESSSITSVFAEPAMKRLEELYSLRRRTKQVLKSVRFEKYNRSISVNLGEMDDLYRALFRRVGSFASLSELYDGERPEFGDLQAELRLAASEFASETATRLIFRYRNIWAELSVSNYSESQRLETFLRSSGYTNVKLTALPLWSLAGLYAGYWIVFLALILAFRVNIFRNPDDQTIESEALLNLIITVTGLAGAQMIAVLWALVPKKVVPAFARPNCGLLPITSYFVFGGLSYLTGVFMSLLFSAGALDQQLSEINWKGAVIFSIMNACTTVAASLAIDWRLRSGSYDYKAGAGWDAVLFGVILSGTNVMVQIIAGAVGIFHTWAFVGIWMVLGLIVGYLLPSSAAAHLTALEADIERDALEGTLVNGITGTSEVLQ